MVFGAGACTSGAPPGFSGGTGDRWSFPLVGPLEGDLLITTVTLGTHGPFLFRIDPDAPISIVDAELVKVADLRPISGPDRLDETDTQRPRAYAEVLGLEVGSLIVERREVMVVPRHTYDASGRRILGVLGRDVLADSLAFGFDRDRGLGHLVAERSFRPPAGAAAIAFGVLEPRIGNAQVLPVPRRLVSASIGGGGGGGGGGSSGGALQLHVDLGAVESQLREELWERAGLVAREVRAAVIDEVATPRAVTRSSDPAPVTLGPITGSAAFIPYADKRWEAQDIAGTLGLGFFAGQSVWTSWHTRQLHVVGRRPAPVAERIARWDSAVLAKCKQPGCIAVRVIDPLAGKALEEGKPRPGLILSIAREEPAGGMELEVTLEVAGDAKQPLFIVNLPPHVDRLIHQLRPELLGKTLEVVDASPFPRVCPGGGGCVDQIAR
ncbi:MAG TPA: hypothetical protein VNO30_45275 [Kofleriaceae bacterium]|nr:hypothetical protein [Kofleriaceae bacterium]